MNPQTFEKFRGLIYSHSGINLTSGKEALVTSRLAKRIRDLGLEGEMEYFNYLAADESMQELTRLIDLMSTNVTHFFREQDHFEMIGQMLVELWKHGPRPVKFWSAACSSGQEPYSLAMVVAEAARAAKVDVRLVKILATDISTRILSQAEMGIYTAREIENVPSPYLARYFDPQPAADTFQIVDAIRQLVTFRRINLSQVPFPMQGPFDAILCRNVMIYFDNRVRGQIVNEAYRLLRPQGYFLIGHSENLSAITTSFRSIRPTVYQKEGET
jgi:chemotaxis protein methyltransferase CheR